MSEVADFTPYSHIDFPELEIVSGLHIAEIPIEHCTVALVALEARLADNFGPAVAPGNQDGVMTKLWDIFVKRYPAGTPKFMGIEIVDLPVVGAEEPDTEQIRAHVNTRLYDPKKPLASQLSYNYFLVNRSDKCGNPADPLFTRRQANNRKPKPVDSPYYVLPQPKADPDFVRPLGAISKIVGGRFYNAPY